MVYQFDHPGIPLQAVAGKNTFLNPGLYQSFFHQSDLLELLQQRDCVGIRLYNVDARLIDERRMIAIGVSSDGNELNQPATDARYLVSPLFTPAGSGTQKMNRADAKNAIEATETETFTRPDIFFASFFSANMIQALLKSPAPDIAIDGIRFYVTKQLAGQFGAMTHCGVPAVLDPVAGPKDAVDATVILSDRPCPGYCLNSDPQARTADSNGLESSTATTFPAGVAATPGLSESGKYLVIW